jgi:ABC-type spermidine/putrescine transport system permease subunit I
VLIVGLIELALHIINTLTFTIIVVVVLMTNLMRLPLLSLFSTKREVATKATQALDAEAWENAGGSRRRLIARGHGGE